MEVNIKFIQDRDKNYVFNLIKLLLAALALSVALYDILYPYFAYSVMSHVLHRLIMFTTIYHVYQIELSDINVHHTTIPLDRHFKFVYLKH